MTDTSHTIDHEELLPILQSKEKILSTGNVLGGLADFWPIFLTVGAIFLIALIPVQTTRLVAFLLLIPCSFLAQLIGKFTKKTTYFAVTDQRLIFFGRKGQRVTLVRSIDLNDIQSVQTKGTNGVRILLPKATHLLSGTAELDKLIHHAIGQVGE
ncbi:hypothetical protein BH10CYA1_BH10CYA1_64140 [soil metagenome]